MGEKGFKLNSEILLCDYYILMWVHLFGKMNTQACLYAVYAHSKTLKSWHSFGQEKCVYFFSICLLLELNILEIGVIWSGYWLAFLAVLWNVWGFIFPPQTYFKMYYRPLALVNHQLTQAKESTAFEWEGTHNNNFSRILNCARGYCANQFTAFTFGQN